MKPSVGSPSKDYWGTRAKAPGRSYRLETAVRGIKHSRALCSLLSVIASLRVQNELFLRDALERHGANTVLDIACGPGQDVVGSRQYAIGVDLPGSPREAALARGYKDYVFYEGDGTFQIDREVDAIVCMNLNAHVPFDLFAKILRNGLKYLKRDGLLILVNEYDNDGISYWAMKKLNRRKWDTMVARMDHAHLEHESRFLEKLRSLGVGEQVERRVLTAGMLPFAHYLWFAGLYGTSRLKQILALAADVPLSILNAIQAHLSERKDRAFLVGHVFKLRGN